MIMALAEFSKTVRFAGALGSRSHIKLTVTCLLPFRSRGNNLSMSSTGRVSVIFRYELHFSPAKANWPGRLSARGAVRRHAAESASHNYHTSLIHDLRLATSDAWILSPLYYLKVKLPVSNSNLACVLVGYRARWVLHSALVLSGPSRKKVPRYRRSFTTSAIPYDESSSVFASPSFWIQGCSPTHIWLNRNNEWRLLTKP